MKNQTENGAHRDGKKPDQNAVSNQKEAGITAATEHTLRGGIGVGLNGQGNVVAKSVSPYKPS